MARKAVAYKGYDKKIAELRELVSEIQNSDASFEKQIEQYRKGLALVKECKVMLGAAEEEMQAVVAEMDEEQA